jgi:predicted TIM-barrel fold metal-dependent hydrolase
VTFSENVTKLGYPSIHSEHWDPFFAACEELGMVVCLHIGSSSQMVITADDAPMDVLITLTPINIVQAAADLVWSRTLKKFRNLKVALSEGGTGWIPYFRERIDYTYERHRFWTGQDMGDRLPSQVFDEQVVVCFIDDPVGVEMRHKMNIDMVCWECDYPHSDSTWPQSPEFVVKQMADVPDDEIDKMTHGNAMRLFQYDPFTTLGGRENCTVGALRAEAEGWDVTIRAQGIKATGTGAMDLLKMATTRGD